MVNNSLIADITTKANLFKNIFVSQCSPFVDSSTLPNFSYKTEKRISDIEIKEDDVLLAIKNFPFGWYDTV